MEWLYHTTFWQEVPTNFFRCIDGTAESRYNGTVANGNDFCESGAFRLKKETYLRLYRWASPRQKILALFNRAVTLGVYGWFIGLCAWLLVTSLQDFLRVVLVCGSSFAALSLFRRAFNAPRPYEVFGIPPVIPKETKGKSYPSRHVFSIFIIGACTCVLFPWVGAVLCGLGFLLAAVRVVTGVHFVKDVLAGCIIGLVCGLGGMALPFWPL